MKRLFLAHALILCALVVVVPAVSHAQAWQGLVPCGGPSPTVSGPGIPSDAKCDFTQLLKLVNNIIGWIIIMAIPIMTALVAYAGYLFVSDQGSASNISKAKDILTDAIIGFVIILTAYVFVKFLLVELTEKGFSKDVLKLFF